ncbi:MAG TPA: cyclic nucleotide-binding domain-containing protein, partial [Chloroflexota bacterium]|nr:cyclic nucleotide-binding domain-containing protein [Chloroflexota bacterium]
MQVAARTGQDAEYTALLKQSMPFQVVSNDLLQAIVGASRRVSFKRGEVIYERGEHASDLYVLIAGRVEHVLGPGAAAANIMRVLGPGEVFGWAALLKSQPYRLAKSTALDDCECMVIDGKSLLRILEREPETGNVVMSRFATMITRDFTVPQWVAQVHSLAHRAQARQLTGIALTMFRLSKWLRSPRPYLMVTGFALFIGAWYLAVEVWKLPRFEQLPGPTSVLKEWLSKDPVYGTSLFTPAYYLDIWVSVRRVAIGFFLATVLGIPLGLFLGWSEKFKQYVFPIFEMLRPIPVLAWVPLAIIMFTGLETPVIFLVFLASFYATALNT